jgi:hypothetical protein
MITVNAQTDTHSDTGDPAKFTHSIAVYVDMYIKLENIFKKGGEMG